MEYHVREDAGTVEVKIINKKMELSGRVNVVSVDKEAISGIHFEKVDEIVAFE